MVLRKVERDDLRLAQVFKALYSYTSILSSRLADCQGLMFCQSPLFRLVL